MLLALSAILVPVLILSWWLRRQTTPSRPWLLVVAVLGATSFSFWWSDPFTRYWFGLWDRLVDLQTRSEHPLLFPFVYGFVAAAFYEEVFKLIVLVLVCWIPRMLGTGREGVVWGALVGMGHALGENLKYHLEAGLEMALIAGGARLVFTTALGVIMGYSLGEARAAGSWRGLGMTLLALIALHGFYDFGALVVQGPASEYLERDELPPWPQALSMLVAPACLVITVIWGFRVARKALAPNLYMAPLCQQSAPRTQ
jgi:RsiW-degrading membrane proteinase PrsW (M82 family)